MTSKTTVKAKKTKAKARNTGGPASLFERIGGAGAVEAAVGLFYDKVLGDKTLTPFFDGVDMDRQRGMQREFLTMAFVGPSNYTGRDLRAAHAPLVAQGLNETRFNSVTGHLQATLEELGVPQELLEEVMTTAASTKDDILAGDASTDDTDINTLKARLAKAEAELATFKQMVDQMPVNVMVCDLENFEVAFANSTSTETLRGLEHLTLIKADELVGTYINIFLQGSLAPAEDALRSEQPAAQHADQLGRGDFEPACLGHQRQEWQLYRPDADLVHHHGAGSPGR